MPSIFSSVWPACYPSSINVPETPDLENGLLNTPGIDQRRISNIPDENTDTHDRSSNVNRNGLNSITSYNNKLFSENGEDCHSIGHDLKALIELNTQTNVPIHCIVRYLLSPLIIWILWNRFFVVKLANTLDNILKSDQCCVQSNLMQTDCIVESFSVKLYTIIFIIVAVDCMVPLRKSTIIGSLTQKR